MTSLRVLCPAKINTFLAVGPKQSNGYHQIRTHFQSISLADTLTISTSDKLEITCDWPDLPEENTLTKTVRLLNEFGDVPHLNIHLEKRIPAQSGLGGGSSDAAGLLRAINRFMPSPFTPDFLQDVAVSVGADVPFFLAGGRARGEGFGEKITSLDDLDPQWLVVLQPDVSCATGPAYEALDKLSFQFREFPNDPAELYNDFERVMPCECDDWSEHLLLLGATQSQLTGSGSAVFGLFESEGAAQLANADLSGRRCVKSWVARTLSRSESLQIQKTDEFAVANLE